MPGRFSLNCREKYSCFVARHGLQTYDASRTRRLKFPETNPIPCEDAPCSSRERNELMLQRLHRWWFLLAWLPVLQIDAFKSAAFTSQYSVASIDLGEFIADHFLLLGEPQIESPIKL